jgi:hypothetical protein
MRQRASLWCPCSLHLEVPSLCLRLSGGKKGNWNVRRLGGLHLDQSPLGSDNDVYPTQLYIMIVAKVGKKQLLRR